MAKKNSSVLTVTKIAEAYIGDPEKQIKELKKCVREGRKSGDLLKVGAAHCYLAETFDAMEDMHGVLINALKAITILKDSEEYELIAKANFALGHAYTNQGNNQMALACDESAYEIVKKHRIKGQTRIMALNNLSVSYHIMDEPKKSIRYLNECIGLLQKDPDRNDTDLVMYSINLAGCHKDIEDLDRADEIYESISGLLQKVDFQPLVCDYYLRRAIVAFLKKDLARGNGYVDTAFRIFPTNVYPLPLYNDLFEIGRMLTKNKDQERAKKVLDLMMIYAENNEGTLEQLFATRMMAHYYKGFGEYQLASECFAKCEELNEKQMSELKAIQLKLHNTTRNTQTEINRLTQKMRENEELVSLEPLTKLLNRLALLQISAEFIESAAKKRQKVGAVFIDIDCFKECNDTYGHARGDEIIKKVARICKSEEAANIRFARYGGDEFFGIAKGLTDDEVRDLARRICKAVRSAEIPNEKNPNGGRLTLSVGIANVAIKDRTDTILEIANYADKALYHAKNAGRNAIYELVRSAETKDGNTSYVKIDF